MYQLLYVDNDPATEALRELVDNAGFEVVECCSGSDLRRVLHGPDFPFDAAIVDYRLEAPFEPEFRNGIDATKALLLRSPDLGIVGISAYLNSQFSELYGSVIGDWLLAGARWFCDRSVLLSPEDFEVTLGVLVRSAERARELRGLRQQSSSVQLEHFEGLNSTLTVLDRIARLPAPVLILGETGTGKELLARRIHELSPRSGAFVVGNCANLRGELAEVMLHGQEIHHNDPHARGYPKPGWFEQADGGTLFLDEIGDLPLDAQASLLRVLQERHVRRVLGDEWIPVDFRLVAATNCKLESDIATKLFRSDLYFRICAFPVTVPPLRDRRQDIPRLVEHFRNKYNLVFGRNVIFPPGINTFLGQRDYPGNIRELENIVQRFVALSSSEHPAIEEITSLVSPSMIPPETNERSSSIETQSQYADELASWMAAHLEQLGPKLNYRSRTAFVRAAVKHVCSQFVVPPDFAKSPQYILKELLQHLQPELYRSIIEKSEDVRGSRNTRRV